MSTCYDVLEAPGSGRSRKPAVGDERDEDQGTEPDRDSDEGRRDDLVQW
jgi:hypothetical protein